MTTTAPEKALTNAFTARELVCQLLAAKLLSPKKMTELTVTAFTGGKLIWHSRATCAPGANVICTTRLSVAQLPTTLGDIFETICSCVTDPDNLARLGGWSDVESVAINAWLHTEPSSWSGGGPTQRRDELAKFEALAPAAEDLEALTGSRGRKLRTMLTERRTRLEALVADELAREEARQARIAAQQQRRESAPTMPWDSLTEAFRAQVDAGLPPVVALTGLDEAAHSFVMLENGIEFPNPGGPVHCGDAAFGIEPLAQSDGAKKFREAVDSAISAYAEEHPDLAARLKVRAMHMSRGLGFLF